MKNINHLLSDYSKNYHNLKELRYDYQEIIKELEMTTKSLKKMHSLDEQQNDTKLNLIDKLNLLKLLRIPDVQSQIDFDTYQLIKKLLDTFPDLERYCQLKRRQDILISRKKHFLTTKICLENFGDDCSCQHQFIRVEDQLMCINCDKTTKEYQHTIEDIDFLVECAISQELFIAEVTKEEIPLIKILKEQFNYIKENTEQIHQIKIQLKKARMLDKGVIEEDKIRVNNPQFLTDAEAVAMFKKVNNELLAIKKLNSRFQALILEQYQAAKYEILILSGLNIPVILANYTKNDNDITALAKAYYNLMSDSFRINSGYFDSEKNAVFYTCLTTNELINKKVLEMKRKG